MSTEHHLVTPRGPLTTVIRHLQDQARANRVNRAPGTRIIRGPNGVRVRGLGSSAASPATTSQPPRWL